ncbi:MAG TPA: ATP-binding cassette domain-containing protein, partial [Streptosporangiaceae bacterium]
SNFNTALHGAYLLGLKTSIVLSIATAIVAGIFGLLVAYAIFTAKRGNVLRQVVITASGVFANFGGVPLAILFAARAVRHLDPADAHRDRRRPDRTQARRCPGSPVHRRRSSGVQPDHGRAGMTTNTARNAAAADGTRQTGRTGGTSVSLQGLSRSFGTTRALDGLSLEIAPGEFVALLGPSGCGKTTALRIVAGFESADTGSVLVDGKDISSVSAARRDMGMVFQSYSLFPNMNALDNVAFGLRMRKQGSAQRRKRAGELLDMVGLVEQAQQYPHQLSGGQQQRVALARALAIEPRVLLLDEPLSALDAKVRLQLREQIRTLQQRLGTTTLFVTHDQEEALSMADRVGVMRQGKLEQIAAPNVLYDDPVTAFVAEFDANRRSRAGQGPRSSPV